MPYVVIVTRFTLLPDIVPPRDGPTRAFHRTDPKLRRSQHRYPTSTTAKMITAPGTGRSGPLPTSQTAEKQETGPPLPMAAGQPRKIGQSAEDSTTIGSRKPSDDHTLCTPVGHPTPIRRERACVQCRPHQSSPARFRPWRQTCGASPSARPGSPTDRFDCRGSE